MKKTIGEFLGFSGVRLCMQSWKPDGDSAASVILMHGGVNYCDMEMYDKLARKLADSGYAVYSFDQRGFGRSEGKVMHINSWQEHRGDFAAFLHLVHTLETGKKTFAYGLSFGACQVIDQAIVSPHLLDGIIANSFSTLPTNVPPAAGLAINIIGKLFPLMRLPAGLDQALPGAREKMAGTDLWRDPLCPATMTVSFPKKLFKRKNELAGQLHFLTIPVLHQQGLDDTITLPDHSIAEKIGSKDYTYKEYPQMGHGLLDGVHADDVINDICTWLEERRK